MRVRVAGAAIAAVLAGTAVITASSASAAPTDFFTQWAQEAEAAAQQDAGQLLAVNDNLTCDVTPSVAASEANPRVQCVVGEVYGNAVEAAHWKCASLDTGKVYSMTCTVTDMYFHGTGYVAGAAKAETRNAIAGQDTADPVNTPSYPGGSAALNTWHYARAICTTTTGRLARAVSQLFYVAGA
jgi:hypothetical protein